MSLHSEIAARIRAAAQLWSCDPDDCPECDCGMDDERRKRIHDIAEMDAKDAIEQGSKR